MLCLGNCYVPGSQPPATRATCWFCPPHTHALTRKWAANLPALRMKSLKNCWHPGNEGGGQGPLMLWGTTNLSCNLFRRLRLSGPSILRTSWSGVSPQLAPPPTGPLHIFRRQKEQEGEQFVIKHHVISLPHTFSLLHETLF